MGPVLIVSTVLDLATDRVVDHLNELSVPVVRVNTEDVPNRRAISVRDDGTVEFRNASSAVGVCAPRSIWYRRLRSGTCPEGTAAELHHFCANEASWTLRAALEVLGATTRWMSRPADVDVAEMKPFQLQVARQLGFRTPRTLVSSDPSAIRGFLGTNAGVPKIVKTVRHGYVEVNGVGYAMYTRRVTPEDLGALDASLPCPAIWQDEVPKACDVRATIVGDEVYAAAIESQADPAALTDWRRTENPALPHRVHELPEDVKVRCRSLAARLGLAFGAMDLVLRPDGEYVFLEVNPNGQWLWIEDQLGLPISEAVARWLTN